MSVWTAKNLLLHVCMLIALGSAAPALSQDDREQVEAYTAEASLAARSLTTGSLTAFFERSNLPTPSGIQINAKPDFVRVPGAKPTLRSLSLNVTFATDLPSTVVREARLQLARDLSAQGYLLTEAEGTDPAQPIVILRVEAKPSLSAAEPWWTNIKDVVVVACMALATLSGLALSLILLLKAFTGGSRVRAKNKKASKPLTSCPQSAIALREPAFFADQLRNLTIVPKPDLPALPAPPAEPARLTGRKGASARPPLKFTVPQAVWRECEVVSKRASATSREQLEPHPFEKLPFEQAIEVLRMMTPGERRTTIDRLNLLPPLRRRIEAALLQTPPS